MSGVAFILPGFSEKISHSSYRSVARYFRSQGIKPVMVDIHWDKKKGLKGMEDYVKEFLAFYDTHRPRRTQKIYVLGYSFGAMIACISAERIKPDTIILCSLSPYFKEDLPRMRPKWRSWAERWPSGKIYSFKSLAKHLKMPIVLIHGSKEPVEVMRRANEAHLLLPKSKSIVSFGSKHELAHKTYQQTVRDVIDLL